MKSPAPGLAREEEHQAMQTFRVNLIPALVFIIPKQDADKCRYKTEKLEQHTVLQCSYGLRSYFCQLFRTAD